MTIAKIIIGKTYRKTKVSCSDLVQVISMNQLPLGSQGSIYGAGALKSGGSGIANDNLDIISLNIN